MLVFTCLNVRAIHVEMLEDMGRKFLMLALVRFSNLYVIPEYLYGDNSRLSFLVAISNLFLNSSEYQNRFGILQIKHLANPLYSLWMASVGKKMIKTNKQLSI